MRKWGMIKIRTLFKVSNNKSKEWLGNNSAGFEKASDPQNCYLQSEINKIKT